MLPSTELATALQELLSGSNIQILLEIIKNFYCVEGKITTRNLARYSSYSLRTLFRFLSLEIDWIGIRVVVFKKFIFNSNKTYIAATDEVVEGKSRKKSYGIGTFYSSIFGKPIPSICLSALSVIDVESRTSYALAVEQLVYTEEDDIRIKNKKEEKAAAKKRNKEGKSKPKGRKKGSSNKEKTENLTVSYRTLKILLSKFSAWWKKLLPELKITHLVADAAYGTQDYMELAKSNGMFLISRFRGNTALFYPSTKPYAGRGRRSIYGNSCNLKKLPNKFLKETKEDEDCTYDIYNFEAYNKSIPGVLLNAVVVHAKRKKDGKESFIVFFSNDLKLSHETLLEYYSLRFQIEFNFRDAKQHFGFSDFKNHKKNNLTNFVNLSFLMCLIDKIVLKQQREKLNIPKLNTTDLKAIFNGRFTAEEIIKLIRKNPDSIFNEDFCEQFLPQTLIHRA